MNTLYSKILERVEKRRKKLFEIGEKEQHKVERIKFIEFCLENRLTYQSIADMLGITKGRVYQLIHYIDSKKEWNKNKKKKK